MRPCARDLVVRGCPRRASTCTPCARSAGRAARASRRGSAACRGAASRQRGQRRQPRREQRLPAEVRRLDVDHAAARDGGGRGDGEVLHLEDHGHAADMAMISPDMRQSFLLSSSTVFMFSIQMASTGPSKSTHWRSPTRVLRAVAVDDREDAVGPLVRHRVELAVELAHRDRLGVEHGWHLAYALVLPLLVQQRERRGERAVARGLAREGQPDDHEAVAHEDHLVELR